GEIEPSAPGQFRQSARESNIGHPCQRNYRQMADADKQQELGDEIHIRPRTAAGEQKNIWNSTTLTRRLRSDFWLACSRGRRRWYGSIDEDSRCNRDASAPSYRSAVSGR